MISANFLDLRKPFYSIAESIMMVRLILCLLLAIIMIGPFGYARAELGFRSNSKVSILSPPYKQLSESPNPIYQPFKKSSINSTSKGIQLNFQDYPLGDVLKNIHDETGIRFNLSPEMEKNLISFEIKAKNWKILVQKLIKDYSRVEIWTNKPKTSQVWLVESNPYN
jgi:hypothetical protein